MPDYLIWNKCKVYLDLISLAMIRAKQDTQFWHELKSALENWNPRAHIKDIFVAPFHPDLNRGNTVATDQIRFDPFEASIHRSNLPTRSSVCLFYFNIVFTQDLYSFSEIYISSRFMCFVFFFYVNDIQRNKSFLNRKP